MTIDLSLNETQRLIQSAAREFFDNNCPPATVRALEASDLGYSPDMWKELGQLGWIGITYPEQYGGSGGSFLDLYPLYDEMGRHLVPSPHLDTAFIAGETILAAGSESQKQRILPAIADGSLVVSPAILEPSGEFGPHGITLSATAEGNAFVLNGAKLLVPFAHVAGCYLVAARTRGSGPEGVSLFLVDAGAPGVATERLPNIAGHPLFAVTFSGVSVPADNLVGALHGTWPVLDEILAKAAVLQATMVAGAGEVVLSMTADYAKDRVQFGQPIGRYQAVQYMVSDILIDTHLTRLFTKQAAWRVDAGLPYRREAEIAAAKACSGAAHLMRQAHEVHAGIGFMVDHDLQLYSRRAKYWEYALGDARYHHDQILEASGFPA